MSSIPIRIMSIPFDETVDLMCFPKIPEATFRTLAFSMILPYLERYLIKTMQEALPFIKDETLSGQIKQFIGQEAQHYNQHMQLNKIIRESLHCTSELKAIEEALEKDYDNFSRNKSLKFNLPYAQGFEAVTYTEAIHYFEKNIYSLMKKGPIKDLFIWHTTEEIEHGTVAFDAYQHLHRKMPGDLRQFQPQV